MLIVIETYVGECTMKKQEDWVAGFAKDCVFHVLLLVGTIGGFYLALCLRTPFPTFLPFADGAEVAGPIAGVFMWFAILYVRYARKNKRELAVGKNYMPRHGKPLTVAGVLRPLGETLTAPLSGEECVGYAYEMSHRSSMGTSRSTKFIDYEGWALVPCEIRSPLGDLRVFAKTDKELYYEVKAETPPGALRNAQEYIEKTDFGPERTSTFGGKWRSREVENGPGDFRVDRLMGEEPRSPSTCLLEEKLLRPDERVYTTGVYDAERQAIEPHPDGLNTPFHLVKGNLKDMAKKTRGRYKCAIAYAFLSLCVVAIYYVFYVPGHNRSLGTFMGF